MHDDDIAQNLGRLLRAGTLPSRVAGQAERVHDALTHPKRVTIMGPPKSGKSDLMALLAGNRVVAADVPLGTVRLVYGETAKTVMTMPDGEHEEMEGVPTAATFEPDQVPVETTIHAPLASLRKITLMLVAEKNDVNGQVEAMSQAAENSDIVIWCTTKFSAIEQRMWAYMPDHIRDHAFVLRTSLDGFDRDVAAARSDLGKRAGDEFAFVLATDLMAALSAQVSVPVDTAAMKKSGAAALISILLKEIEQGRQNAADQARLILAKYPAPGPTADDKPAEAPVSDPVIEVPQNPVPETAPAPNQKPVLQVVAEQDAGLIDAAIDDLASVLGGSDRASSPPRAKSKPKRRDPSIFPMYELDDAAPQTGTSVTHPVADTVEEEPALETPPVKPLSENAVAMCNDMIEKLSDIGSQNETESDHRALFDAGLKALNWIEDALGDTTDDDLPRLGRLQNMTEEASDLIQLLRLEKTETAAIDAATILLQMKRNVHAVLAA